MWTILILIAFVFMLTYDPKSGTLNTYIAEQPNAPCKDGHYQEIQFARKGAQCSTEDFTKMGYLKTRDVE